MIGKCIMTSRSGPGGCPGCDDGANVSHNSNHIPKDAVPVDAGRTSAVPVTGNGCVVGSSVDRVAVRSLFPRRNETIATDRVSSQGTTVSGQVESGTGMMDESLQPSTMGGDDCTGVDTTDAASGTTVKSGSSQTAGGILIEKDEDPYAELERILERAQAEISEMFEQTLLEENLAAVAAPAGSDKKRKNDLKAHHDEEQTNDNRGPPRNGSLPQQHHHHDHRQQQHASHHVKYATIPHAHVTHQSKAAIGGAHSATIERNHWPPVAADGGSKRTRNSYDPRYRSHDRMELVSSTTSGMTPGSLPKVMAVYKTGTRSQSAGEAMYSSGYSSYGRYTERSDSLSDDMSLLDVRAACCGDDSQEGAGDDTTSDERDTIVTGGVRKRHQPKGPSALVTSGGTVRTGKTTSSSNSDRSMKTSTNSLPSEAVGHRNLALHLKFKSHQSAIDAKRKQFFLTLDQEPFQPLKSNMADLPSPSSTSLHSGHNHLIAEELGSKSSSAPVLLKDEENILTVPRANLRYSRSQSDRHLAEIEAIEACRWLRAAGFPQYAQMYEDHQFPIVVEDVAKDHPFLENDPLQSLFRRLHTLNRCANMHLDAHQHTPKPSQRDDSDDDSCALSEAWTFQHNSRRWSRVDDAIGLVSVINNKQQQQQRSSTRDGKGPGGGDSSTANGGSQTRRHNNNNTLLRAEDHEKLWLESGGKITIGVPSDTDSQDDCGGTVHLRRTGSERLKDGAKAILRRVESIKSRRRKKQNRDGLIILAPPPAHSSAHLSPHHGASSYDVMSYSNPTSPRPSSEMLAFGDALDAAGNRRNPFGNEQLGRRNHHHLMLSPNSSAPSNAWSPLHGSAGGTLPFRQQVQLQQEGRSGDDSSSICSEDSGGGGGTGFEFSSTNAGTGRSEKSASTRKYTRAKKALRSKVITSTVSDDVSGGGALSDSECHAKQRRSKIKIELVGDLQGRNDDGVSTTTTTTGMDAKGATLAAPDASPSKLHRGGSLNLGKASRRYRDAFSNRSVRHSSKQADDGSERPSGKRPTVARWHSFQQPKVSPIDLKQADQLAAGSKDDRKSTPQRTGSAISQLVSSTSSPGGNAVITGKPHKPVVTPGTTIESGQLQQRTADGGADPGGGGGAGLRMSEMSCGQLLVVRKLGLANLTGYMERYCPTHRSGWNWDLPKFIKRIKTPDYKDRRVFGLPLVMNLQKYGGTVPHTIRLAFGWLERNALDQVGLFRKPGVKSRIAKLRSVIEASNDVGWRSDMFDEYHAYDVADLLKQYFRELPDPLLTGKLSETFIAIFQYLPEEVRAEAVQSAILLLPDEHREVLHLLLTFLERVVRNSSLNQMTANNLAVCFAPSLFYLLSGNRYTAASPRRKKTGPGSGAPDEKELSEAKASHECLAYMIDRFQSLWTITSEQMRRCNFNYMDESKPVPLASLGMEMHVQNWRGYLSESINECLREGRERPRGWVSLSSTDPSVATFFKKVGDGHPLRLWKCVTEVEAPPMEVIEHIVKERQLWDAYLMKWRTVEQLDHDTDVFQYACGQPITEYCVVRQWKNDLPRGACVIVEVSISHENATCLLGGVNGVVLASRYLIEPCGSGKCKLMHLSRVDMKGRTPDWYNKNYGHICQQYLSKIKKFFEHYTEGPETKV